MDITFFITKGQYHDFLNSPFARRLLSRREKYPERLSNGESEKVNGLLSPQLENILQQIIATKDIVDPVLADHVNSIEDTQLLDILNQSDLFSGWREKSLLVRSSVLALEHKFTEPLIHAAAAVELLGIGFCIVDDVLDETTIHGHRKTVWHKFGYKEAICASEVLCAVATKMLMKSCNQAELGAKETNQVSQAFESIKLDAYTSQFTDIRSERLDTFSEKEYFEMISRFPGTLYANALEIVCVLAGARHEELLSLKEFGRLFAMANQIRDDLIEIIGEEEVIGKKVGADILQNKKRLPLILFNRNSGECVERNKGLYVVRERIEEILSIMRNDHIVAQCIRHIDNLVKSALLQIDSLPRNQWEELLRSLSLYLTQFDGKYRGDM